MPRPSVREAEDRFIDLIGAMIEFWGFKRILGQVWAWTYLEETPVTAAEIGERLGLSKAAVSITLKELESWGCVHRLRRPGERRELFKAETDLWTMVSRVFRQRELPRLSGAIDSLDEVAGLLGKSGARGRRAKVDTLVEAGRLATETLRSLLDQGPPRR